ncbi:MAG: LON peptidase substrate-binding domain-containing protein, partial [Ignavibacteria bacterium]|nr:LON peptidase substrate-binding domain-containing protein [Ignavibacteria bacterium]
MKPKKPKESIFTEEFMSGQNIEFTDVLNENAGRPRDIYTVPKVLPVLPLKDIVILPYMVYPILAGRESSIKAINSASETEQKFIFLVAQKDSSIEQTDSGNLYSTGTVAKIMQIMRMPNGLIKILVDGFVTANAVNYFQNDFINAEIKIINDSYENIPEIGFMSERISKLFSEFVSLSPLLSKDVYQNYEKIIEFDRKLYYILSNLPLDVRLKQRVIDVHDISIKYFEEKIESYEEEGKTTMIV